VYAGKLYGRIIVGETECILEDELSGFRRGRGCVDQIFALRGLSEKLIEKDLELYTAFIDLEKAYDREAMWQVLRVFGVSGILVDAIKKIYERSVACVRIGQKEGPWFPVRVGLRQG
jgi:hypothetical protein